MELRARLPPPATDRAAHLAHTVVHPAAAVHRRARLGRPLVLLQRVQHRRLHQGHAGDPDVHGVASHSGLREAGLITIHNLEMGKERTPVNGIDIKTGLPEEQGPILPSQRRAGALVLDAGTGLGAARCKFSYWRNIVSFLLFYLQYTFVFGRCTTTTAASLTCPGGWTWRCPRWTTTAASTS